MSNWRYVVQLSKTLMTFSKSRVILTGSTPQTPARTAFRVDHVQNRKSVDTHPCMFPCSIDVFLDAFYTSPYIVCPDPSECQPDKRGVSTRTYIQRSPVVSC